MKIYLKMFIALAILMMSSIASANEVGPVSKSFFEQDVVKNYIQSKINKAERRDVEIRIHQRALDAVAQGLIDSTNDYMDMPVDRVEEFYFPQSKLESVAVGAGVTISIAPGSQKVTGLDPTTISKVIAQSDALGWGKNSASQGAYNTTNKWFSFKSAHKINAASYLVLKKNGTLEWLDTCAATVKSASPDITVVKNPNTCEITWKYKGFAQTARTVSYPANKTMVVDFGTNIVSGCGSKSVWIDASKKVEWNGDHAGWNTATFNNGFSAGIVMNTANGGAKASVPTPNFDRGLPSVKLTATSRCYFNLSQWAAGANVTKVKVGTDDRIVLKKYFPASVSYAGTVGNQLLKYNFGSDFVGPGINPLQVVGSYIVSDRIGWSYTFSVPLVKDVNGNWTLSYWNKVANGELPANDLLNNDSLALNIRTKNPATGVVTDHWMSPQSFTASGVVLTPDRFRYGPYVRSTVVYSLSAKTLNVNWNVDKLTNANSLVKASQVAEAQYVDMTSWVPIAKAPLVKDAKGNFTANFTGVNSGNCGLVVLKLNDAIGTRVGVGNYGTSEGFALTGATPAGNPTGSAFCE